MSSESANSWGNFRFVTQQKEECKSFSRPKEQKNFSRPISEFDYGLKSRLYVEQFHSCPDLGESSSDEIQEGQDYRNHLPLNPSVIEEIVFDSNNNNNNMTMKSVGERHWNMGKISVILLVLFSLTDLLINLVDAQMDILDAFDDYDALSSEVIRPPFRYRSSLERKASKPKLGLGSAAISSVTTALSPILPFAGGVDLRREDYWTNGLFGSFGSVLEQVRDAFSRSTSPEQSEAYLTTPRGGSTTQGQRTRKSKNKKSQVPHVFALSSPEPFVSLKEIAQLTLREVAMAFRYALENTQIDFNRGKFISGAGPRVRKLFDKMSTAAATSRGKDVKSPTTGLEPQWGDIDALHFCAAMRIFAEWRVLRQVPDGYKGYAVGMSLGQKDIIQNVAKIEQAVHDMIDHQKSMLMANGESSITDTSDITSPTLQQLLQFEVDTNVHSKLPRLKEKSAGMGLLWVRRQLHYQTALFSNIIKVPEQFESTRAAISAAYSEVYDQYHGWTVQKIFNYSFQAAPDCREIYRFMNPQRLKEVTEAATLEFLGGESINCHHNNAHSFGRNHRENIFDKVGRQIGHEWAKVARSVVHIFNKPSQQQVSPVHNNSHEQGLSLEVRIDDYINQEMERDAHEQILEYLGVAEPLLQNLATLFEEFNMDDPTKV